MADREDAQRGFLITGQSFYLLPTADSGISQLPALFADLRAVTARRGRGPELSSLINEMEATQVEWVEKAARPEVDARRELDAYLESSASVAALIQAGTGKAVMDTIRVALTEFVEIEEGLALGHYESATAAESTTRRVAFALLGLALGAGILIAFHTRRAIAVPLASLVDAAKAVGTGDLGVVTAVQAEDEVGEVAEAFNTMVSNLSTAAGARVALESQLLQAQKLESIGHMAAGIEHELNTPIQYVGDNTRFLQESFGTLMPLLQECSTADAATIRAALEKADVEFLVEEIPRAFAQSLNGLDRVTHIVQSIKEFSHPGAVGMSDVDINHTLERTITVATNEWKYVAEMKTDFDPELPAVPCRADQISQVFLNLIINAVHAIRDVVGETPVTRGIITISTRRVGGQVEIRVQDTGTGIPEAIRGQIFDPFFTTKAVGQGTGQGLAITHGVIVGKHGGTIDCETEEGTGTTFVIRLPLERARRAA